MADNYLKSKLKRKKSSVEDVPLGKPKIVSTCSVRPSQAEESRAGAVVGCNRDHLPALDSLWTLTLKAVLPDRENQHWDLVPDLPPPSTGSYWPQIPGERLWCDLSEDVTPFPEPPSLSPRSPLGPDPVSASFPHLDLSAQTKPMTSLSSGAQTPPTKPTFHSQAGAPSSEGPPCVDVGEKRTAENETVVNRQPSGKQTRAPQQDDDDEGGGGGGGGGGRLQSCPMCLLVFPIGFTQMDCDGHLAQCLSEMNVDMTW